MSKYPQRQNRMAWWHTLLLLIWIDVARHPWERWVALAIITFDLLLTFLWWFAHWLERRLRSRI